MTIDVSSLAAWWRSRSRNTQAAKPLPDKGALIGHTSDERPIIFPLPSLESSPHAAIFAGSGVGKTALAANWCTQEIVASNAVDLQQTFFVVDAKGDLIHAILSGIAHAAPERLTDVYILDPFSAEAFPFNLNRLALGNTPLDIRSAQLAGLVGTVSTATGTQAHLGVGSRQVDVLSGTLLGTLAADHPAANPGWAHDALTTPGGPRLLAALTKDPKAKAFLEHLQIGDELKSSCSSRLRSAFSATSSLERLIAAPTCIQFAELFAAGRIVLCDLGRPTGGLISLTKFYANLLVRLGIEYLMERPSPYRGHHVRVIIDECQIVAPVLSDLAEHILTTGRSRAVSLTLITQQTSLLAQASDALLPVIWSNCPTKIIGRLSAADALLLSREVAPTRGTDEPIRTVQGRFSSAVATLRDREFFWLRPGIRDRFDSAYVHLSAWEEAAERQAGAIAAAKSRLALSPSQPPRVTLSEASLSPRTRSRSQAAAPSSQAVGAPRGETPSSQQLPPQEKSTSAPRPTGRPRSKWG